MPNCLPSQIVNPETNRCVLKTGAIGKKILGKTNCLPSQIVNPKTNRCVSRDGAIGKKIPRKDKSASPVRPRKSASPVRPRKSAKGKKQTKVYNFVQDNTYPKWRKTLRSASPARSGKSAKGKKQTKVYNFVPDNTYPKWRKTLRSASPKRSKSLNDISRSEEDKPTLFTLFTDKYSDLSPTRTSKNMNSSSTVYFTPMRSSSESSSSRFSPVFAG